MGFGNLGSVVMIIFIFSLIHLFLSLTIGISEIRNNWDKYKCNPGIIPFAGVVGPEGSDPVKTAEECIKLTQVNFMGVFLEPIYAAITFFMQNGNFFTDIFNDLKVFGNFQEMELFKMFDDVEGRIVNAGNSINIAIFRMTDTFHKLGFTINSLMYVITGLAETIKVGSRELPGTIVSIGTGTSASIDESDKSDESVG
jgi:hypothetical protein